MILRDMNFDHTTEARLIVKNTIQIIDNKPVFDYEDIKKTEITNEALLSKIKDIIDTKQDLPEIKEYIKHNPDCYDHRHDEKVKRCLFYLNYIGKLENRASLLDKCSKEYSKLVYRIQKEKDHYNHHVFNK